MREKVLLIIVLLSVLTIMLFTASGIQKEAVTADEEILFTDFRAQDMIMDLPKDIVRPTATATPTPEPVFLNNLYEVSSTMEVTYTDIEYEYLGTYYITAYCPAECGGSWETASGATCHRSDDANRLYKPTTCAIDRNLHSFGDLFYIEEFDRVFVAEDTGSAVKGKHLDLFYEDYDDVYYFPTGYYTVYSVKYVEKTRRLGDEV